MTTAPGTELSRAVLNRWRTRLAKQLGVERDLPWRRTRDPWEVLVAEVMLQQTQVSRVIPAWTGFLDLFPTPRACASAPQSEIVRAWEGLGYHRRAVALHGAAREVVARFGGELPDNLSDLLSLPGVGPYSARAVLAFAFEDDVAVVDTNVARILSRAVAGEALGAKQLQEIADALVPKGNGWAHNQAMLDFGALQCTSLPRCQGCPLRRSCQWARSSWALPDPARRSAGTARPQPRFEGSDRQLRGLVLELARRENCTKFELEALREKHGEQRMTNILASLVDDGLLARSRENFVLA